MTAFLVTVILLVAFEAVGFAVTLLKQNTTRDLEWVPLSIAIDIAVIIWAAVLLGGQ